MDGTETLPNDEKTRKSRTKAPTSGGQKVTEVTRREYIDEREPDADDEPDMPGLFDQSDIEERSIVRIRVIRKDPNEGMLGYIEDPNGTEQEIKDQWGGGTFRLEGLNENGKIVRVHTIKLAGDPVFLSISAESQWRRSRGLNPASTPTTPATPAMSIQDMMMFWREQETARRQAEDERRQRESEERREHEAKMRTLELGSEERRRSEERDREDRRRRDEQEREERHARELRESETRQQSFMQNMLTMVRQSANQSIEFVKATSAQAGNQPTQLMDAIKTVVAIKEAFAGEESGGGEEDPLTMLVKHGPAWMQSLGNTIGQVVQQKNGQLPGQPQQPQQLQSPQPEPGSLVIPATSPIAPKVAALMSKIAAKGQDPEQVLSHVLDNMIQTVDGKPPAPNPQAPPVQPAPAVVTPNPPAPPAPAPVVAVAPSPPPNGQAVAAKARVHTEKTTLGSTRLAFS